jgi:hypothetical protein
MRNAACTHYSNQTFVQPAAPGNHLAHVAGLVPLCRVDTLLLAPLNVTTHSRLRRSAGNPKNHFCNTFFYARLFQCVQAYNFKDVGR